MFQFHFGCALWIYRFLIVLADIKMKRLFPIFLFGWTMFNELNSPKKWTRMLCSESWTRQRYLNVCIPPYPPDPNKKKVQFWVMHLWNGESLELPNCPFNYELVFAIFNNSLQCSTILMMLSFNFLTVLTVTWSLALETSLQWQNSTVCMRNMHISIFFSEKLPFLTFTVSFLDLEIVSHYGSVQLCLCVYMMYKVGRRHRGWQRDDSISSTSMVWWSLRGILWVRLKGQDVQSNIYNKRTQKKKSQCILCMVRAKKYKHSAETHPSFPLLIESSHTFRSKWKTKRWLGKGVFQQLALYFSVSVCRGVS